MEKNNLQCFHFFGTPNTSSSGVRNDDGSILHISDYKPWRTHVTGSRKKLNFYLDLLEISNDREASEMCNFVGTRDFGVPSSFYAESDFECQKFLSFQELVQCFWNRGLFNFNGSVFWRSRVQFWDFFGTSKSHIDVLLPEMREGKKKHMLPQVLDYKTSDGYLAFLFIEVLI